MLLLRRWIAEKQEEKGGEEGEGSQKKRRMWKKRNKKSVEALKTLCMVCRAVGQLGQPAYVDGCGCVGLWVMSR
jgi:hypothetical protein